MIKNTKADRADLFRARLTEAIARAGSNRSALARAAGVDRSTIAQLLADDGPRMPNAHLAAACAEALGVSADWLLGLTDRPERPGDVIAQAISMTDAARTIADDQLMDWHREAAGYKIRHVPATLPDLVKTKAVLSYEFAGAAIGSPEKRHEGGQTQLAYERRPETDTEVCSSLQSVEALARGEAIWRELPKSARREQLARMAALTRELYPTFRWFLFDARQRFSAPLTIFGPLRAAIYLGERYIVLNSRETVATLARHLDGLIRAAIVQPHEVSERFASLAAAV